MSKTKEDEQLNSQASLQSESTIILSQNSISHTINQLKDQFYFLSLNLRNKLINNLNRSNELFFDKNASAKEILQSFNSNENLIKQLMAIEKADTLNNEDNPILSIVPKDHGFNNHLNSANYLADQNALNEDNGLHNRLDIFLGNF